MGELDHLELIVKKTLLKLDAYNPNLKNNQQIKFIDQVVKGKCSTHPHNIILEFISELGSIGLIFIFYKFYFIIINYFYLRKNKKIRFIKYIKYDFYFVSINN